MRILNLVFHHILSVSYVLAIVPPNVYILRIFLSERTFTAIKPNRKWGKTKNANRVSFAVFLVCGLSRVFRVIQKWEWVLLARLWRCMYILKRFIPRSFATLMFRNIVLRWPRMGTHAAPASQQTELTSKVPRFMTFALFWKGINVTSFRWATFDEVCSTLMLHSWRTAKAWMLQQQTNTWPRCWENRNAPVTRQQYRRIGTNRELFAARDAESEFMLARV